MTSYWYVRIGTRALALEHDKPGQIGPFGCRRNADVQYIGIRTDFPHQQF